MQGCFLILNYKDTNITQKALQYLKKLDGIEDCIIIIYDNGSENGSLELLKKLYKKNDKIIVSGSKVNLGFSEGNNAAYKIALKYSDRYDFAVVMNSDVMIHQKDFINRIRKYVDEGGQAVIGPDVYNSLNNSHDNPLFMEIPSTKEIDRLIESHEMKLKNIGYPISEFRRSGIRAKIRRILPYWAIDNYRKIRYGNNYGRKYMNILHEPVLNGCCLIYLEQYLEHESLLFEPDTFLYGEEILLSIKCNTKGYKMTYDPSLQIEHRGSISAKADRANEEYMRQKSMDLIRAYKIVRKYIDENPWETAEKNNTT